MDVRCFREIKTDSGTGTIGTERIGVNRPAILREILHFGLFPVFLRERPAFLALFQNIKNCKNRNNFRCMGGRHFVRKSSAKR